MHMRPSLLRRGQKRDVLERAAQRGRQWRGLLLCAQALGDRRKEFSPSHDV